VYADSRLIELSKITLPQPVSTRAIRVSPAGRTGISNCNRCRQKYKHTRIYSSSERDETYRNRRFRVPLSFEMKRSPEYLVTLYSRD